MLDIINFKYELMFFMRRLFIMANLSLTDRIIINEFKEKNNWICYYCNKNIDIDNKNDLTVDHKTR